MKIVYFAWLREKAGVSEETVSPPDSVNDVRGLIEWLRARAPGYAGAFEDLSVVRVAVNQEYATLDARLAHGDEIAFFPPVTGG
jgi:molybdopterin synthase sulfur carrier subunit